MGTSEITGSSRPLRGLTLVCLGIWAVLALGLPLTALTLNAVQIAGFPLGFWFAAQGALAALALLAWLFVVRAGGARQKEGLVAPAVFAGEAIGSAGFIGYAGLIAALGFDALSLPLGAVAGLVLMAILIAPQFVLQPVASVPGYFTARFGGVWARRVALTVLVLASVLLLAADLRGAGLALQALSGLDFAVCLAAVAVALPLIWLGAQVLGGRRRFGLAYGLLLAAYSLMLVTLALAQSRLPLPYWSYGLALQDVASAEIGLISRKLADVRALKPLAAPFLQLSMWNFAGTVLAVALGIAALPQLLGRHVAAATVAPGEAARRVTLAASLVAVFLCGLAPFAVFARAGIAKLVESGAAVEQLPAAIADASARGWISVCAAEAPAAGIVTACAKVPGHKGQLRLQDMVFDTDAYVFAASRIAGLPDALWLILVAGALTAALVAGHALLSGFLAAEADARRRTAPVSRGADPRSAALGILVLTAAVSVAATASADIAALASEGLALVAASLFPALVLGLYWQRFNAAGAVAAMLAGFVATAVYIAGVRLFPLTLVELTGSWSTAPPAAFRKLANLEATLARVSDPALQVEARAALHAQAMAVANWWGLRPAAAVLFALPLAFAAGVLATLAGMRRQTAG